MQCASVPVRNGKKGGNGKAKKGGKGGKGGNGKAKKGGKGKERDEKLAGKFEGECRYCHKKGHTRRRSAER